MNSVLIVEDEPDLANVLRDVIAAGGPRVDCASSGTEGLAMLRVHNYDLVILDWMLPAISGVDVCKSYRAAGGEAHVLMLTAKSAVDDKALALDIGADDYLSKPFDLKELMARVRALLRRPTVLLSGSLDFAGWKFAPLTGALSHDGKQIHLLPREAELLAFLVQHPNTFFTAEALVQRVWPSSNTQPETARTHIKNIRKKLNRPDFNGRLHHVRGYGYRIIQ